MASKLRCSTKYRSGPFGSARTARPLVTVLLLSSLLVGLAIGCGGTPELPVTAATGSGTPPPGSCGDRLVQPGLGETCDDGGTAGGDGCSATCTLEGPFQGFVTLIGGGREDSFRDVAVASDGFVYAVGGTESADFPVTSGAFDTRFDSGANGASSGPHDVVVARFTPTGQLDWATFVGGPGYDRAYAVEVDSSGVYVAGRAGIGFPTTPSTVLQPSYAGDDNVNGFYGPQDGFVLKLSLDGRDLLWSTYFGDPGPGFVRDLAIDADGDVYVAMTNVTSANPHVTPGSFDDTRPSPTGTGDSVVAKISGDGQSVVWGTWLGGSGEDLVNPAIRVNGAEEVFVTGQTRSTDYPVMNAIQATRRGASDMAVTGLSADGSSLLFSTYLGGGGPEETETHSLALTPGGNVIVAATTASTDFPTTPGAFQRSYGGGGADGFVTELTPSGSLVASTYIGGRANDELEGVDVDVTGVVLVSGITFSSNFPTAGSPLQSTKTGGTNLPDGLVALFAADLQSLLYGSYAGGTDTDSGRGVDFAPNGDLVIVGHSNSFDFPTTDGSTHDALAPGGSLPFDGRDGVVIGVGL